MKCRLKEDLKVMGSASVFLSAELLVFIRGVLFNLNNLITFK
jgi:hypothetical protein